VVRELRGIGPAFRGESSEVRELPASAALSEANPGRFARSPARERPQASRPPSLIAKTRPPTPRASHNPSARTLNTNREPPTRTPARRHPAALRHPPAVPASLRPPRHRVSPTAVRYWAARALAGWLVVAGAQVVWLLATDRHRGLHVLGLAVTALVGIAHAVVMPQWRYRVHRWEVAPEAVYTRAGWLHQESRIAPISRIQTVDSERGPLEQIFGLANVTVTTASAAGPLEIHGLDRTTAQRLVDELTTAAQATRGDAT
jgi:uncharacterized protein